MGWDRKYLFTLAVPSGFVLAGMGFCALKSPHLSLTILAGILAVPPALLFVFALLLFMPRYGITLDKSGLEYRGLFYHFKIRWSHIGFIGVNHLGVFGECVQITTKKKYNETHEDFRALHAQIKFYGLAPYWGKNQNPLVKWIGPIHGLSAGQLVCFLLEWRKFSLERTAFVPSTLLRHATKKQVRCASPSSEQFIRVSRQESLWREATFIIAYAFLAAFVLHPNLVPESLHYFVEGVFYGPISFLFVYCLLRSNRYFIHLRKFDVLQEKRFLGILLSRKLVVSSAYKIGLEEYFEGHLPFYPVVITGILGRCVVGSFATKRGAFLCQQALYNNIGSDDFRMEIPLGYMDGTPHEDSRVWQVLHWGRLVMRTAVPVVALYWATDHLIHIFSQVL